MASVYHHPHTRLTMEEQRPLYSQLDPADITACARMLVYIDDTVTEHDFVNSIYPEARYNEANSWDSCGALRNDAYARYCRLGKHDLAASLSPDEAVGRFYRWHRSKCTDANIQLLVQRDCFDTISLCWQFLGRLSHDIGIFQCIDIHNGDSAQGEDMMRRFQGVQRRGSLFWLGASAYERQALVAWQDGLDKQYLDQKKKKRPEATND